MSHVALVPLTGFRLREPQMAELGMSLPGLRRRAKALGELPALGLLTLAGMTTDPWTCSYHAAARWDDFSQPSNCSCITWQLAQAAGSSVR